MSMEFQKKKITNTTYKSTTVFILIAAQCATSSVLTYASDSAVPLNNPELLYT